jgi:hypothetical protein
MRKSAPPPKMATPVTDLGRQSANVFATFWWTQTDGELRREQRCSLPPTCSCALELELALEKVLYALLLEGLVQLFDSGSYSGTRKLAARLELLCSR